MAHRMRVNVDESTQRKACTKCGQIKPLSEFHRRSRALDGRTQKCAECRRTENREHMASRYKHPDPEARRAYQAEYRERHAAETGAYKRRWRQDNAEDIAAKNKAWREANRARVRVVKAAYYDRAPEVAKERVRAWCAANPERVLELRNRRRARVLGNTVGTVDIEVLWTGICGICEGPLDRTLRRPDLMSKSLDHIIPLARGGTHSQDNLQWTHLVCNLRKGLS